MIRRRDVLVGVALAALGGKAQASVPFAISPSPNPVLSPPILTEAGKSVRLDHFAGRFVLLNVFASWCAPCRSEMPAFDRLATRLKGQDVTFLPLCVDAGGIAAGRRFYREIGIRNLPLYSAELLRVELAFAVSALPTTLLIDRNSRELGRREGSFAWDSDNSVAQLSSLR